MNYVAGLLFDPTKKFVVLINKNRPEWQKGHLNAVGGKIEYGEGAYSAMSREFYEETGAYVDNWKRYCRLRGEGFTVNFFWAVGDVTKVQSQTDEVVTICGVHQLPENLIPNLYWLIPMALVDEAFDNGVYEVIEL